MIRWQVFKGLLKGCRSLGRHRELGCTSRTRRYSTTGTRFKESKSLLDDKCFTEESLMSCYTLEQQQMVLRTLNAASVEELRQFAVSKQRATSLVRQRERKGVFTKLEDVLEVEDFGIKLIQNLCDNIVYGPSEEVKKQATALWKQISHPSVSPELKNTLNSVVSLNLSHKRLVWVRLGRDMDLFDWNQMAIAEPKTYNHKNTLELAHEIRVSLPKADAYIMKRRLLTSRNAAILPHILGVLQLESMMTALLNVDFADTKRHRVFAVKDTLVARFFDLKVGNEIVSSRELMASILTGVHCDNFRKIHFKKDAKLWYDAQSSLVQEELASCLLQAIAFYELEIVGSKRV